MSYQVWSVSTARLSFSFFVSLDWVSRVTAQKHPVALEALETGTWLALQEPARSCQGPMTWWHPFLWGTFGTAPPTHSRVPAGGCCCSTYFSKGVNRLRATGSCFPRAPLGGEHPQCKLPCSWFRLRCLLPESPGPSLGGPSACGLLGGHVGPWVSMLPIVYRCVSVRVSVHGCVCIDRGEEGEGALAFCKIIS